MRAPPPPIWQQTSARPVGAMFSLVSLQGVDLILSIVLTLAVIGILAALVIALLKELRRDTIVVDAIAVPRELADRGYEPRVMAARLVDAYRELHTATGVMAYGRSAERAPGSPDVQLPGGRTSMRGIVRYLRQLFGHPAAEIDGEVTRDGDGFVLRLRLGGQRIAPLDGERPPDPDIKAVLAGGAEDLMLVTDPVTLSVRYRHLERTSGAYPRTERLLQEAGYRRSPLDQQRRLVMLAAIRREQGRKDETEALFRQALALGIPNVTLVHNYLLFMRAEHRNDECIALAEDLLRRARTPEAREVAASALVDCMRFADALELLDREIGRAPHANLHFLRGRALVGLHRHPAAVASFEHALALRPGHAHITQWLGFALALAGRGQQALDTVRPVAELHAGDEWGRFCLGRAQFAAGQFGAAAEALRATHLHAPGRSEYSTAYALALVAGGEPQRALGIVRRSKGSGWELARLRHAEGLALHAMGQWSEALDCFEDACRIDGNDPLPLFGAADALVRLGLGDEATARRAEGDALAARNAAFT